MRIPLTPSAFNLPAAARPRSGSAQPSVVGTQVTSGFSRDACVAAAHQAGEQIWQLRQEQGGPKTVGELLKAAKLELVKFVRFKVGEK